MATSKAESRLMERARTPATQLLRAEAEKLVPLLADDPIGIDLIAIHADKSPRLDLVDKQLGFDVSCEIVWARLDATSIVCFFPLGVSLNARLNSGEGEVVEFGKVQAHFRLSYKFREPIVDTLDESLQHFVGIYGLIHLWPYWRAEVQATTAKLLLPPLTLPVLQYGAFPPTFSIRQVIPEKTE